VGRLPWWQFEYQCLADESEADSFNYWGARMKIPRSFFVMMNSMKKRADRVSEVIGWSGVALILIAYAFVSSGAVDARDWQYQTMNLVGASGVVWVSYRKRLMQTVVLNLFWAAIALFALISIA